MPVCHRQRGIVLLAEDDLGEQVLARRALDASLVQADLRIVSNGEMALDYLHNRPPFGDPKAAPRPDLMLLDLNMPRVDGRQVLRYMREHETFRRIPVVVLTTSKQEEDVVRSYNLGCNSFITKPANLEGFIHAMRTLGSYWFELVTLPSQ